MQKKTTTKHQKLKQMLKLSARYEYEKGNETYSNYEGCPKNKFPKELQSQGTWLLHTRNII